MRPKHPKWMKTYRHKKRIEALEVFDSKCAICKRSPERKNCLHFHKKDGTKHKNRFSGVYLKNPDEFVLLCVWCHKGVHFSMEYLGMTWEEIWDKLNS